MKTLLETPVATNNQLAQHVVEEMIRLGIEECCLAAGSRNAPLTYALARTHQIKVYYWGEERSAAFFALGRIKATKRPVAVVSTSGTAAAELLPAAMTAHYLSAPLLLVTADRPRRFRGSGAPQTAEQLHLFGCYAHFEQDIACGEVCTLAKWTCQGPAHLNVCLEEPHDAECQHIHMPDHIASTWQKPLFPPCDQHLEALHAFIAATHFPLVVVGALDAGCRESAIQFLLNLGAPVYAEGVSQLREDPRLEPLRIRRIDQVWRTAEQNDYPIDGILRLGEIPTARLWRDLEEKSIRVCSISEQPFSGLSWTSLVHTDVLLFLQAAARMTFSTSYPCERWIASDRHFQTALEALFLEEPLAEPSLVHALSCRLPQGTQLYLGNSLPIREWDLAACQTERHFTVQATRGINGIDGQISTFFGLSLPEKNNWALIGDLTALYDLVAPWILPQLPDVNINLVVINNGGGQIFSRMYTLPCFTNPHDVQFAPWAALWQLKYERWEEIPTVINACSVNRLIEIIPDAQATQRFWKKIGQL